jgi:hypothetical protein
MTWRKILDEDEWLEREDTEKREIEICLEGGQGSSRTVAP